MVDISRRSALMAVAGAGALAMMGGSARASGPRTTVIYSPHPDDETLRLTGYITRRASAGDRMILVAATDGGGTSLVGQLGWSVSQMEFARRAEQESAWEFMTWGQGEVIRLGIPDGSVAANKARITQVARQLEQQYGPDVEHYCACRLDDTHSDHRAVAEAVVESGNRVVRVARDSKTVGGTQYLPPNGWLWNAQRADETYAMIGHRSVPASFQALRERGYASYITYP